MGVSGGVAPNFFEGHIPRHHPSYSVWAENPGAFFYFDIYVENLTVFA